MTSKDGVIELEYKQGTTDVIACILKDKDKAIDLTDFATITFNFRNSTGNSSVTTVTCSKGCADYKGNPYSESAGGVEINLTGAQIPNVGQYVGNFVCTKAGGAKTIIPNTSEFYNLIVNEAII